jgi:hypothetical protein
VNYATPAAQQRFHATKHAALIVDHENDRAAQRPASYPFAGGRLPPFGLIWCS